MPYSNAHWFSRRTCGRPARGARSAPPLRFPPRTDSRASSSSSAVKSFAMLNVLRICSGVLPAKRSPRVERARGPRRGRGVGARALDQARHVLAGQFQQALDVQIVGGLHARRRQRPGRGGAPPSPASYQNNLEECALVHLHKLLFPRVHLLVRNGRVRVLLAVLEHPCQNGRGHVRQRHRGLGSGVWRPNAGAGAGALHAACARRTGFRMRAPSIMFSIVFDTLRRDAEGRSARRL